MCLCVVVLAASFQYWRFECWTSLTENDTPDMYFATAATCDPWVMWVAINTVLHLFWVGTLLACQTYQVSFSNFSVQEDISQKIVQKFVFLCIDVIMKRQSF